MAKRKYSSGKSEEVLEPIEFELDDVEYTCNELTPLMLSEIMRMQGMPADSPESMAFMAKVFRALLGSQYENFSQKTGDFSTRVETFVEIIQGIFQDISERDASGVPTMPQSDYSDGLRSIEESSMDGSSSRAMHLLKDRPDLQVAILRAREA